MTFGESFPDWSDIGVTEQGENMGTRFVSAGNGPRLLFCIKIFLLTIMKIVVK